MEAQAIVPISTPPLWQMVASERYGLSSSLRRKSLACDMILPRYDGGLSRKRCIFPVGVLGKASMNFTDRG
jgi:hypothetical protein